MRYLIAALALASLLAAPAALGQLPRCCAADGDPPHRLFEVRQWIESARPARTITVDCTGAGDYTTLGDAAAYLAAQTRDSNNWWMVLIRPCTYAVSAQITLPSFTHWIGPDDRYQWINAAGTSPVKITSTAPTTGSLFVCGDKTVLANVEIQWNPTLTGPATVIEASGSPCTVENVTISSFSTSFATHTGYLMRTTGTGFLYFSDVVSMTAGAGTVYHFRNDGGGMRGRWGRTVASAGTPTGYSNGSASSLVTVIHPNMEGTFGAEFADPGGGGLALTRAPRGVTSLPATCFPYELTVPSVSGGACTIAPCLCVCSAVDTWTC